MNYTYDNDSRLIQVTDPTGTYQFTFDNMGRLTQATTQYTFLTERNFTASYSYDAASNRTGFTDPENGSTSYVYDRGSIRLSAVATHARSRDRRAGTKPPESERAESFRQGDGR